jgi:hypothetical protein
MGTPLADSGAPVVQLYSALLGDSMQLEAVDERLEQLGLNIPEDLDPIMAAVLGAPSDVAYLSYDHFRTWRKNRIALLAREYGDQLDDLAEVLSDFAAKIKTFGPEGYMQSMAHRGERRRSSRRPNPRPDRACGFISPGSLRRTSGWAHLRVSGMPAAGCGYGCLT